MQPWLTPPGAGRLSPREQAAEFDGDDAAGDKSPLARTEILSDSYRNQECTG
jgi:hypothetical protein